MYHMSMKEQLTPPLAKKLFPILLLVMFSLMIPEISTLGLPTYALRPLIMLQKTIILLFMQIEALIPLFVLKHTLYHLLCKQKL